MSSTNRFYPLEILDPHYFYSMTPAQRSKLRAATPVATDKFRPITPDASCPRPIGRRCVSIQRGFASVPKGGIQVVLSPNKHEQLLRILDTPEIEMLKGNALELERLLSREGGLINQDSEMAAIKADPKLNMYYTNFTRLLTGSWLACHTVDTKLVKGVDPLCCEVLKTAGSMCSLIQPATAIVSFVLSQVAERDRADFVRRIATRFPTLQSAFDQLDTLARQLTFARKETIQNLKEADGFKSMYYQAAAFINADDMYRSAITRQAKDDCEALLKTIYESGESADKLTNGDMIFAVTGRKPAPPIPPRPKTNATHLLTDNKAAPLPRSNLAALQQKVDEHDATIRKLLPPSGWNVHVGGGQMQVLLPRPDKHTATEHQVILEQRVNEQNMELAALKEQLALLQNQVDNPNKNQPVNGCCILV